LINNRIKTKEKLRIYQKGFEHSKAVTADDFINFSFYEYNFFKIFTVNEVLFKKKYSQISSPEILANIAGKMVQHMQTRALNLVQNVQGTLQR
jgi:hypothetical protein